jgi:hypothetical protein
MGCWGVEAYSNDHTYDCLPVNIHTLTQEQCDAALAKARGLLFLARVGGDYEQEAFLGVVAWTLTSGKKVKKEDLEKAIDIAATFLGDEEYIGKYTTPDPKKYALEREIKAMEYALEHDGVAELEKGKGLLENIEELFRKPPVPSKRDTILEQMQSVVTGNLLVTVDMIKEWRDFVNSCS